MRLSAVLRPPQAPLPAVEIAVVVDVLRASTSLAAAAARGVGNIRVADSLDAARAARRALGPAGLLGGEGESLKPADFDLGNSPREYAGPRLRGATLVFASTNGSRAARRAGGRRTLMGCFANRTAVLEALRGAESVRIVCAGLRGGFALEDAAFAGDLARRLAGVRPGVSLDGGARAAWALAPAEGGAVRALLAGSSHGRALRALGPDYAADVEDCGRVDAYPGLPWVAPA